MALKLLVVDDDPQVVKVIQLGLEAEGHEVLPFSDAEEAARCVDQQPFDGAVIDAVMPVMDGFALVRRIRASGQNGQIPIVMLTGYDDILTMRRSFESGVTVFMGKPFNREKLSRVFFAACQARGVGKRHSPRVLFSGPVHCECGSTVFSSNTLNISEGGALLQTSVGLNPGRRVDLWFELPRVTSPMTPGGRVVRTELPDRMGVQFVDLRLNQRMAIREFVAKRS